MQVTTGALSARHRLHQASAVLLLLGLLGLHVLGCRGPMADGMGTMPGSTVAQVAAVVAPLGQVPAAVGEHRSPATVMSSDTPAVPAPLAAVCAALLIGVTAAAAWVLHHRARVMVVRRLGLLLPHRLPPSFPLPVSLHCLSIQRC